MKGREHSQDLGVGGSFILRRILGNGVGLCVDRICVSEYEDRWRDLVNTVIKLKFHNWRDISWPAERLSTSLGLCSMQLMMMMIIMSMDLDYVSEPLPPTSLLFIPPGDI
jgi:hypothetical protein